MPPKPPRRWLSFSLRTRFAVLTVLAGCLGVFVNNAREQREAVKAIEEVGGTVRYDWHFDKPLHAAKPGGPLWLRRLIGDDFFQEVETANFLRTPSIPEQDILKLIPHLRRLRGMTHLQLQFSVPQRTQDKLRAALPNCEIVPCPT